MEQIIATAIFTLIVMYLIHRVISLRRTYSRLIKQTSKAKTLSKDSDIGDFVHFSGHLAMAPIKTPYGETTCGYYGATVRAEFETKAKKPKKGMVTHRPILLQEDSEALPLLIENDDLTAHLVFAKNLKMIKNLNTQTIKYDKPPNETVAALAKPKHQRFVAEEVWLPVNASITLWGCVVDKNEHCFTVAQDKDGVDPVIGYHGNASEMYQKIKRKRSTLTIIVLCFLFLIAVAWLMVKPSSLNVIEQTMIYLVLASISGYIFGKLKSSPFSNQEVS